MIPIFIPVRTSQPEPKKCPQCDKPEDIKKVCRHCSYEYKETDSFDMVYVMVATISFIALLTYMMVTKAMCFTYSCSFMEVGLMFLLSVMGAIVWPLTGLLGILFLLSKLM